MDLKQTMGHRPFADALTNMPTRQETKAEPGYD